MPRLFPDLTPSQGLRKQRLDTENFINCHVVNQSLQAATNDILISPEPRHVPVVPGPGRARLQRRIQHHGGDSSRQETVPLFYQLHLRG